MTRAAWADLATALARLRTRLIEHAERGQQAAHLERVIGVDLAARTICRTLRMQSKRFDARKFMRTVRLSTK